MFIVNPYHTIFNDSNWFFNNDNNKFSYSDASITIDKIYLHIPFKDNEEYNKKIIIFFDKFMKTFTDKICTYRPNIKVSYFANLNSKSKQPVILFLKPVIYTDNWIKITWEITNHL